MEKHQAENAGATPVEGPQPESAPPSSSSSSVSLSERETLPRYGIEWVSPTMPISVPRENGYWTPWHLASAALARLQSEREMDALIIQRLTDKLIEQGGKFQSERESIVAHWQGLMAALSERVQSERETHDPACNRGDGPHENGETCAAYLARSCRELADKTSETSDMWLAERAAWQSERETLIAGKRWPCLSYFLTGQELAQLATTQFEERQHAEAEIARLSSQLAGLRTALDGIRGFAATFDEPTWAGIAKKAAAALAASKERKGNGDGA